LINTSRGRIINESALLQALKNKRISGAALDVFDEEPLNGNNPLVKYANSSHNLLLTPHLGASTNEAANMAGVEIARNVRHFMDSFA
jgi:D-3-phosphoglycerate dehydrogenase / 2-oxoglutarate reductase